MTNATRVLFGFDWRFDALVVGSPTGPILIQVSQLQAMGWIATTEGFQTTLPRLDPSMLDHPAIQAAATANIGRITGGMVEVAPPFQNRAARRAKR